MTEAEWLACTDPMPMLDWLAGQIPPPTERKMRLLLAGAARQVWDQIPPGDLREAVQTAERYADGAATTKELSNARGRYYEAFRSQRHDENDVRILCLAYASSVSSRLIVRPHYTTGWRGVSALTAEHLPGLIRCIFGPLLHRPVSADPSWLTSTAVALAQTIYTDRAFDRLPILVDTLEEAGCDDADILTHCREPGPHVRGCWVVDLVLGKE
jgi:hypothetical protein